MTAPSQILRRPFHRYLRWLGSLLLGYLALSITLTTTVDPWRINQAPWAISSIDAARDLHKAMRVGKAALANRRNWQALILGSSRLDIALDPNHPAFHGLRTVNLAMSGATLYEVIISGNYALDRNPLVKLILLGIDPGDLHSDADSRKANQFEQSPFADDNHSIERTINQLIGAESLGESIATLQRHFRHNSPHYSPLGQMRTPPDHGDLRTFVESDFIENTADQWQLRPQILRPQKAAALAQFLRRTREAGITVMLVIPPQHALKQIHPTLDRPEHMAWETDLLALADICRHANQVPSPAPPVQLWSFLTFNSHTTAAMPPPEGSPQHMHGWFDLGHANSQFGNQMLDCMLSPSSATTPSDIGICLTRGDWNAHRTAWIDGHQKYCTTQPQDVAWWRALVARANHRTTATP